jgi:hypothetical protein
MSDGKCIRGVPVPSHVVMWVTWQLDTWHSGDITYGDLGDMAMECVESTSVTETWHIDTWHSDTWHSDACKSIGGTYHLAPPFYDKTAYHTKYLPRVQFHPIERSRLLLRRSMDRAGAPPVGSYALPNSLPVCCLYHMLHNGVCGDGNTGWQPKSKMAGQCSELVLKRGDPLRKVRL